MKISRRGLLPMLLAPVAAAKANLFPALPASEAASETQPFSAMGKLTKVAESLLFDLGEVVAVSIPLNGDTKVVRSNLVHVEHCLFTAYARFVEITTREDTWRKYGVTAIEGELVTSHQRCRTTELRRMTNPYGAYTAIHKVIEVWHATSKLKAGDIKIKTPIVTDESLSLTTQWDGGGWDSKCLNDFQLQLMDEYGPFQVGEEITEVFDVPLVAKRPVDQAQINRVCDRIRAGLL